VRGAIRMLSYASETVALIPLLVDQARRGNPAPLKAQARMVHDELDATLARGMHHSVLCTEDVPRYEVSAARRRALDERTYLGAGPLEMLERVCRVWPEGVRDADLGAPLQTGIPTLILSGGADPITPPAYGDRILSGLDDGRHLVAEHLGHGLAPHGCVPRLIGRFVDGADPGALETGCFERLAPAPFFLGFTGPAP